MTDIDYDALREFALNAGNTLLWAAVWLLAGWWLSRIARGWVRRMFARHSMGRNGAVLVSRLVSLAIRIASVLVVLSILGVSGTGLLAVVSAFTVAIGLSLQDVLKNFFAGIYLLLEQPFRAGDRIMVRDVVGEVQGIDIRTTLVKNLDNELVLIPNATIFTEILRNDTHFGVRRLDFTVTTDSRSLHQVEERMQHAIEAFDGVKRPMPAPRITSSTPSEVTIRASLVIDNQDAVENAVTEAVVKALDGDTIEVHST